MTNNIYVQTVSSQDDINVNEDSIEQNNITAKSWACKMNDKVEGIDYSAKYYAAKSKTYAEDAKTAKNSILNNEGFIAISSDLSGNNTIGTCAENLTIIQGASLHAQNAANSAQTASAQAAIATQKAEAASAQAAIATQKAEATTAALTNYADIHLSNISTNGINIIKQAVDFEDTQAELTEKLNKTSVKSYVTETYQNGASWYRIYSDGWIEQGGCINFTFGTSANPFSITFLKEFSNTNYYKDITIVGGQSPYTSGGIESASVKSMGGYLKNSNQTVTVKLYWIAAGYKA